MISWNEAYVVDCFGILVFLVSYYRSCYRKGYRLDLWHAHIFLFCVLPYMLLLPFGRSELNTVIVGQDFAGIVEILPRVFLVAMAGYLAIFVGGSLWSLRLGAGVRRAVSRVLDVGPQCSTMLMSSCGILVCLSLVCIAAQLAILCIYFASNGFGFNLRAYTFENPGIRPFSQLASLCSMVVVSHCTARYLDTKERVLLVCAFLLTFGLLFFGQRGNLVFAYLNLAVCYIVQRRNTISLLRIGSLGVGLLMLIFYLGNVREGLYSLGEFFTSLAFLALYGNNICDLRDFAWIYSHWNHEFWVGKTYLAGLATFLPRSISDFRGTWSFGVATDWTVGLDTELHPGLKPGEFGEIFFNFGLFGVIVAGLLIGILVRRADISAKYAFRSSRPSMRKAFASTMLISVALCLNTSLDFPFFYALCIMYALGWLGLRARAMTARQSLVRGRSAGVTESA